MNNTEPFIKQKGKVVEVPQPKNALSPGIIKAKIKKLNHHLDSWFIGAAVGQPQEGKKLEWYIKTYGCHITKKSTYDPKFRRLMFHQNIENARAVRENRLALNFIGNHKEGDFLSHEGTFEELIESIGRDLEERIRAFKKDNPDTPSVVEAKLPPKESKTVGASADVSVEINE